jgi:hypothetical protein
MTNKLLNIIKGRFPLTEIDCGEFSKMKVSGMNFEIKAFRAEGLGHISIMCASGFMGLMRMDTLIINPKEIDLPLYSYDRIFAMGNDTLITELYDTVLGDYSDESIIKVKDSYTDLAERDPGEHWYDEIKLPSSISKKGKKNHTARLDELTIKHFEAYLGSGNTPVSDRKAKQDKARVYVNGLIEKGGPSTDVFKKSIGEKKTRELFDGILFGTKY